MRQSSGTVRALGLGVGGHTNVPLSCPCSSLLSPLLSPPDLASAGVGGDSAHFFSAEVPMRLVTHGVVGTGVAGVLGVEDDAGEVDMWVMRPSKGEEGTVERLGGSGGGEGVDMV